MCITAKASDGSISVSTFSNYFSCDTLTLIKTYTFSHKHCNKAGMFLQDVTKSSAITKIALKARMCAQNYTAESIS